MHSVLQLLLSAPGSFWTPFMHHFRTCWPYLSFISSTNVVTGSAKPLIELSWHSADAPPSYCFMVLVMIFELDHGSKDLRSRCDALVKHQACVKGGILNLRKETSELFKSLRVLGIHPATSPSSLSFLSFNIVSNSQLPEGGSVFGGFLCILKTTCTSLGTTNPTHLLCDWESWK